MKWESDVVSGSYCNYSFCHDSTTSRPNAPSVTAPAHTQLFPLIAAACTHPTHLWFCFYLVFLHSPKLLDDQAVTLISPRAGSVSGLGMESDEYKANDPVLDVPRDLFSITASLVGKGPGSPCSCCFGLSRDPWLKAQGGAGVSGVIQRLLRGNLNHHRHREQVCQPCFSL